MVPSPRPDEALRSHSYILHPCQAIHLIIFTVVIKEEGKICLMGASLEAGHVNYENLWLQSYRSKKFSLFSCQLQCIVLDYWTRTDPLPMLDIITGIAMLKHSVLMMPFTSTYLLAPQIFSQPLSSFASFQTIP